MHVADFLVVGCVSSDRGAGRHCLPWCQCVPTAVAVTVPSEPVVPETVTFWPGLRSAAVALCVMVVDARQVDRDHLPAEVLDDDRVAGYADDLTDDGRDRGGSGPAAGPGSRPGACPGAVPSRPRLFHRPLHRRGCRHRSRRTRRRRCRFPCPPSFPVERLLRRRSERVRRRRRRTLVLLHLQSAEEAGAGDQQCGQADRELAECACAAAGRTPSRVRRRCRRCDRRRRCPARPARRERRCCRCRRTERPAGALGRRRPRRQGDPVMELPLTRSAGRRSA